MGGSPVKIIKKTIDKAFGGGSDAPAVSATSAIQDRREEVVKETAPKAKKLVNRRIRRSRRTRSRLAGFAPSPVEALGTGVRNPTGTGKTKLGAQMDRGIPEYKRNPRFIDLKKSCECKTDCECQKERKKEDE